MRIAMVASEVAPFSKEGGLADVLGALPAALAQLGEDPCVISPFYRGVAERAKEAGVPVERVDGGAFRVLIGDAEVAGVTWRAHLPGTEVPVYFLQNDRYYDRDGYYVNPVSHDDFQDNSERFIFLSRGSLEMCRALDFAPDVLHAHDWHTGLVPIYVRHVYTAEFPRTATVFTVHNLAYQGIFWHWDMKLAGLPWRLFNWQMLEYYGNLSFLKAGLVGADVLTTVSKQYSREIQTEEFGLGLDGVLRERSADLFGIVNGVDVQEWGPATDPFIPARYSLDDLSGKAGCKQELQRAFGLPVRRDVPVIGMVCRLVAQKGLDILGTALPELLRDDVQFVVLGQGEPQYRQMLEDVRRAAPARLAVKFVYDNEAAHLIEAGADMFLMPSYFEPCGLNQLYSLLRGTVPVVRATGGLADTVTDYTEDGLASGESTGFVFDDYSASALVGAVRRALAVFADPDRWRRLMRNGMRQDWSWKRSAREYVQVYGQACAKVIGGR
jgi:starch synthase